MEKIEFYQRSAVIAMNVIKYFDLIVCFEKKIIFNS